MKQDDPKEPAEVEQPVTTNEGKGEAGTDGEGEGSGPGGTNPNKPPKP